MLRNASYFYLKNRYFIMQSIKMGCSSLLTFVFMYVFAVFMFSL